MSEATSLSNEWVERSQRNAKEWNRRISEQKINQFNLKLKEHYGNCLTIPPTEYELY